MSRIDLGDNMKKPTTVPATAQGFYERTDSKNTGDICAQLADALEQCLRGELSKEEYKAKKSELKIGAAFYTPHAHFNKAYKSKDGDPVDSGKAIIDVDGNPNGREIYELRIKGHEKELGINMFNISIGGGGFAVLFDIPEGLERQQAQAWMAHQLGDIEYDKAVHERERGIYIPCREYILYLDEQLMFGDELHPARLSEEELEKYRAAETKSLTTVVSANPIVLEAVEPSPRALAAFDETLTMTGLDLATLNREGVRHNTLKLLLPTLCQMMSQEELLGVLSIKMSDYSKEQDCLTLVSNFYEKYVDQNCARSL